MNWRTAARSLGLCLCALLALLLGLAEQPAASASIFARFTTANVDCADEHDHTVVLSPAPIDSTSYRAPLTVGTAPSQSRSSSGSDRGIAAKSADHVLPIGPASEKAWSVVNRVDAKGSPLPGYKGGVIFKNSQGKLPETPGVAYREWDVNPYTKGVDRGAERIVTGSDGSAYWTGDHYDTFLMFRGAGG